MIYLDNAATTYPKPRSMMEKIFETYEKYGVNASRGKYKSAQEIMIIEKSLRENISKLARNTDTESVVLTSSATLALNQIIQGIDYSNVKIVYISPFEHNAVYRTIIAMQKKYGFILETIPFKGYIWDEANTKIKFAMSPPDIVLLTHASNVFGNILPVDKIFELSRESRAINILDASQTFGLVEIPSKKYVDFVVFAGHKTLYGPSGIGGFLYLNKKINIDSLIFGGTGIHSEDIEMPLEIPERFEVGSHNTLSMIGLKLSTDWLLETGVENIKNHKKELISYLFEVLSKYSTVYCDDICENVGVLSCVFSEYSPGEMREILSDYDVAVRTGLHCAPYAHEHMGTKKNGTIRFSVGYFNTIEEIKKLDGILSEIIN